jgi:hypothetical protein
MPGTTKRIKYRKKVSQYVVAVRIDLDIDGLAYRKWGGQQHAKRGDWLVDNHGDVYTVDAKAFAKTYRQLHPGIYVKTTPIWADVATTSGHIKTKEGETAYKRNDYIVYEGPAAEPGYAIPAAKFKSMYRVDK